ncbi:MAG: NAD-binding protein, partial [Alphaproteobacteria bacterium]
MGLPIGLGAFLAGMLMSETIYRHQISSQISPYYTLFMAFFFIALGMGLNLSVLGQNWYIVLFGVIGFMALKLFAVYMVARVRGISVPNAMMIALILSQGSEFALLMLQTMKTSGIRVISSGHEEVLTAIIIISMMLTPLLLWLYDYLQRRGKLFPQRNAHAFDVIDNKVKPVVVVCGFGRVGQIICQMLDSQNIPYVAIDLDVSAVMMGREQGFNVVYGDTTDRSVLIEFGVNARNTRAIAVALDNATTARKTILTIKSISKRIKIFARARNLADTQMLLAEKISYSLPETIESSFLLGSQVLKQLGISNQSVSDLLSDMRANNYQSLSTVISDKYD